jgi:hypothetical protein
MAHSTPLLEDVFKTSGIPTYTFVHPLEYPSLLVALRTPGRGVVVEGPSGIGKTTAVTRALEELGVTGQVTRLTARKRDDLDVIRELPSMGAIGTVLVDDFHRLPGTAKSEIADLMKVMADEESRDSKIVLIGINRAGESLVRFAPDLNNRLDVISLETNPDEKVTELIARGEEALACAINVKGDIVRGAHGSFYIAQMLSHQACLDSGVLGHQDPPFRTAVSFEAIRGKVYERLSRVFLERTMRFARGTRFRREGRAPYLRLLHLLAMSQQWSLNTDQAVAANPGLSGSITQIVEKGYLEELIRGDTELAAVLHFDPDSRILSVEDPQYVYFLRSIPWSRFPQDVGFLTVEIPSRYDFALSFAGADREVANALNAALKEMEFEVFYDHDEQHRILAEDIEDYLRPIYQSDARFVVALLGPDYPKRIWTKFESDQFKERFKRGEVIPVWFSNAPPGMFDESARVGGFMYDPTKDRDVQVAAIADLLRRKIATVRGDPKPEESEATKK